METLKHYGITPDGMIGHSLGELGCAYADDTLTIQQAILVAYARGQTVKNAKLPPGKMAAVGMLLLTYSESLLHVLYIIDFLNIKADQ